MFSRQERRTHSEGPGTVYATIHISVVVETVDPHRSTNMEHWTPFMTHKTWRTSSCPRVDPVHFDPSQSVLLTWHNASSGFTLSGAPQTDKIRKKMDKVLEDSGTLVKGVSESHAFWTNEAKPS